MAVTWTRCRSWQALVNRFGHSLTWHYLGLRGDGKISKIDRKTASDGDRCLRANVGGVHGNARPEIVALTYRLVHRIQDYPPRVQKERKKGEKKANDEAYKAMIKRTLRP